MLLLDCLYWLLLRWHTCNFPFLPQWHQLYSLWEMHWTIRLFIFTETSEGKKIWKQKFKRISSYTYLGSLSQKQRGLTCRFLNLAEFAEAKNLKLLPWVGGSGRKGREYLALGTRGCISSSNSTGRPRKQWKRSTGVPDLHLSEPSRGGRILIVLPNLPLPETRFGSRSIRHATTNLRTTASGNANTDGCERQRQHRWLLPLSQRQNQRQSGGGKQESGLGGGEAAGRWAGRWAARASDRRGAAERRAVDPGRQGNGICGGRVSSCVGN
jgi:hypothetical protein